MSYELVYDAVTTSTAPRAVLLWALAALAVALLWGAWLRARAKPLHAGVKFWGVASVILLGVYALSLYEQRTIARRTDARTVEGPIAGVWRKAERTRRADRSWNTTHWEGFWVNGVPFVYATDVEQNYFHNGTALALHDGMRVRVRYLVQIEDGRERNEIVRFERVVE